MMHDPSTLHDPAASCREGHRPGRRINCPDGTVYLVTETGAWERVTTRRCNQRVDLREVGPNHGQRRRILKHLHKHIRL